MLKKHKKKEWYFYHSDAMKHNLKNNKNMTKNRSSKFLFTLLLHLIYNYSYSSDIV